MARQSLAMSASAVSERGEGLGHLDAAVEAVAAEKTNFARLSVSSKASLLQSCLVRVPVHAESWVRGLCELKGLDPTSRESSEEWWSPYHVARHIQLLIKSLEQIAKEGRPQFGAGPSRMAFDRLHVPVVPVDLADRLLLNLVYGVRADIVFQPGISKEEAGDRQAAFYQESDPEGAVSLVLGAGNVSSIPAMDVLTCMFNEGRVCVLKMNPVNECCGPALEGVFQPLIERGFLRIVYGGAKAGAHLVNHALVDEIHITGSEHTHDRIVWGDDPAAAKEANTPRITKRIQSELGNVTPMVVVPANYSRAELAAQAQNVAMMMVNNASFNCIAGKMLVLAKDWPQREAFLDAVREALNGQQNRKAYYPGAESRYVTLTDGRAIQTLGKPMDGALPWTLITDLDPAEPSDPLFQTEPFCSILSVVSLSGTGPVEFMKVATDFCNETLWGQLGATVIAPPSIMRDSTAGPVFEQMLIDLRYGAVAVNGWSALNYSMGTTPWGAFPGNTLKDVGSGIGFVHNSFMFDGIEKSISRCSIVPMRTPPWLNQHKHPQETARRMMHFAVDRSLGSFLGASLSGLTG